MAKAAAGEAAFEFEGRRYTLVMDYAAIAEFEDATDQSIFEAFAILAAAGNGGKPPKLSMVGSLLCAGLRRHHPEITRIEAMAMLADPAVMAALTGSTQRSMPDAENDAPLAAAG